MVSARSVIASAGRSRAYSSYICPPSAGPPTNANRATRPVTATPRTTSTGPLLASRVLRMPAELPLTTLRPPPRRAEPRDSTLFTLPHSLGASLASGIALYIVPIMGTVTSSATARLDHQRRGLAREPRPARRDGPGGDRGRARRGPRRLRPHPHQPGARRARRGTARRRPAAPVEHRLRGRRARQQRPPVRARRRGDAARRRRRARAARRTVAAHRAAAQPPPHRPRPYLAHHPVPALRARIHRVPRRGDHPLRRNRCRAAGRRAGHLAWRRGRVARRAAADHQYHDR